MPKHLKTAVVTGASTGIGRAIAEALINDGWRVFASVRKKTDADELSTALGERLIPLLFDVTDSQAIMASVAQVEAALEGRTLDALVNNAGVAVGAPIRYMKLEDLERQIDINVYGVVRTTQAFLSALGADHDRKGAPGRIINMSSVAGRFASPFMSPYSMSKHALEAFSDSLRRELFPHGIDVVVIGPGAVKTPIWAKSDDLNVDQYRNTEYYDAISGMQQAMKEYGDEGLPASEIGALALHALTASKPKTRYAILNNKFANWTLPQLLPVRLVDGLIAKRFGLKKRKKTW